jgi:hypothetical protein
VNLILVSARVSRRLTVNILSASFLCVGEKCSPTTVYCKNGGTCSKHNIYYFCKYTVNSQYDPVMAIVVLCRCPFGFGGKMCEKSMFTRPNKQLAVIAYSVLL